MNIESYSTSSSKSQRLLRNPASVSPGNPTMISVVIAMSRLRVLHPLDAPHIFVARVQPLHRAPGPASSRIAPADAHDCRARISIDRVDDVLHEIARMRSREAHAPHSGDLATSASSSRKIPACRRRIAIAVHVLAEQLNFGVARAAPAASLRAARSRWCGCAPARA